MTLVVAFGLVSCSLVTRQRPNQDLSLPAVLPAIPLDDTRPPAAPDASHGAALYEQKCSPCHGISGTGDGPSAAAIRAQGRQVASLIDPARARAAQPSDWVRVIRNGRLENLMPGFSGSLNAQDRWDVLSYVWALGTVSQNLQSNAVGYQSTCASCHAIPAALMADTAAAKASLDELAAIIARSPSHKPVAAIANMGDAQRLQLAEYVRDSVYGNADATTLRQAIQVGDGRLAFVVKNVNRPGTAVTDAVVTLHGYNSASEVVSHSTQLDATGVAVFEGLPRRPEVFYEPEIIYAGGRFFGSTAQLTSTRALTQSVDVYDVSTDPGTITISEWHNFIQGFGEGTLTMAEVLVFDNTSARAYSSANGRSLRISLPPDATNLRFEGPGLGARFVRDGDVLYDLDAVLPGTHSSQISLSYELPYRNAKTFTREAYYPLKSWDVIVPDSEVRVTGLPDRGLQTLPNGGAVHLYIQQQSAPAGPVTFAVSGQPSENPPAGSDTRSLLVALATFAGALLVASSLLLRARHERRLVAASAALQDSLVQQIAHLDDALARGEVSEPYYSETRGGLMARAKEVWHDG